MASKCIVILHVSRCSYHVLNLDDLSFKAQNNLSFLSTPLHLLFKLRIMWLPEFLVSDPHELLDYSILQALALFSGLCWSLLLYWSNNS
jgi:hypothetical protein